MQERRKLAKSQDIDYDGFWYPFLCYVGIICCAMLLYMYYNEQMEIAHERQLNLLSQNVNLADEIIKLKNPLKPIVKKVRKK
jgi:hypothetical protein